MLGATVLGWQASRSALGQDLNEAASLRSDTAEQSLREQMVAYEQVLRGGAGLFQSSNEVTLDEWESFLEALQIDRFSGVQYIGFVQVLDPSDLGQVHSFMKNQGIKDFKIVPETPKRDRYASILYIHPVEPTENLPYGYDMYTEPVRRAAMFQARDSGNITMTSYVELLSSTKDSPKYGFNIFSPYYDRRMPIDTKEGRQKAIKGYVYASFISDNFFEDLISDSKNRHEGYRVTTTNGSTEQIMYESSQYADIIHRSRAQQIKRRLDIYGQSWTIHFVSDAKSLVSNEQLSRPEGLLFFGTLTAFLVSVVVLLLIKARARDLSTQKEKAVELAKDELLSLASHQLRTPATGVKQYVGMVLQGFAGKVPTTQKKLLEKAYASNDRQLRIINEILHLAKIESGRIVLAKQLTNLNELVKDVVNEQVPDVESAKHTIEVNLPKEPLIIHADTHMLRMAIENLLSNAIKYTPTGGRLAVRVRQEKPYAYIDVSDTGVGINPEDRQKIFRQFSRLSNIMSQQVGGTGIGLYLAKHLVELHNGHISMESEPGKGSVFTIAMPLHGITGEHMKNLTVRPRR